jgi:hypothetical protein
MMMQTMMAPFSRILFLIVCLALPARGAEALRLTLPPVCYAVPGVPISVYHDNIVLTEKPESYQFEVKCDVGTSEARRWTVMAADKDVGDHAMEITVKNAQGKVVESGKMMLRVTPRNAGAGSRCECW